MKYTNHPLGIQSTEISALEQRELVELMNRLLYLECLKLGVDPENINTTLQTTWSDGGVDAGISNVPAGSRWLPEGESVWQSKSGKALSSTRLCKEFDKIGVQDALKRGGSYVVFMSGSVHAGDQRNGKNGSIIEDGQRNRQIALQEYCKQQGFATDRCKIVYASQIAEWANEYPAVVLDFRRDVVVGLLTWEKWSGAKNYQENFVSDPGRTTIIQTFQDLLIPKAQEKRFLRIEGLQGVGKSRLALELFRDTPLRHTVLYAAQPSVIKDHLWSYLQTNSVTITLVVDECDYPEHRNLLDKVDSCGTSVRLLTVGPRSSRTKPVSFETEFVTLDQLEAGAMNELLKKTFPGLPDDLKQYVTDLSSGFVKLALNLARAVSSSKTRQSVSELTSHLDIKHLLSTMLPDRQDRNAMGVIALLERVGWEDELADEGKALCRHLKVNWEDARVRIAEIETRTGLVERKGRYRSVTPHLLAIWLTAGVLETIGTQEFMRIHSDVLKPERRAGFEYRVRDLGENDLTRALLVSLFGPSGLFPTLESIEGPDASRFLRLLCTAHPQEGIQALERLILSSNETQLRATVHGRNDLIWTLRALAWRDDLFERAAQLLLELAITEGGEYHTGMPASVEWLGLFRIYLGGTSAPFARRLNMLRETLASGDTAKQILAVKSVEVIFSIQEFRDNDITVLGGAPLPDEWHPSNFMEATGIRRDALDILRDALKDGKPEVQASVIEVLQDIARAAVLDGLADNYLEIVRSLEISDFDLRRKVRHGLDSVLEFERKYLTPEQQNECKNLSEEIAGNGFSDRLRRYFGPRIRGDQPDYRLGFEDEQRIRLEKAEPIIVEALAQPDLLIPEWDWLFSPEAIDSYYFGWALGRKDEQLYWWDFIQAEAAQKRRNIAISTAYLRGQVEAGRLNKEATLNEWMERGAEMALAIYDVIWRGELSDSVGERIILMVEKGWLDGGWVGYLYFGQALLNLSVPMAQRIIEATLRQKTNSALDAAISLIELLMEKPEAVSVTLTDLAWEALERPGGIWRDKRDTMGNYHAEQLAKLLVSQNPARIAEIILRVYDSDSGPTGHDGILEPLGEAAKLAPESVWELVAKRLYSKSDKRLGRAYRLQFALENWFVNLIPDPVLLDWAERNTPEGPLHVARLASVGGEPLNALARELLVRFGEQNMVRSILHSKFMTGGWWGPMSNWLNGKLDEATKWTTDPDQKVRQWAVKMVSDIKRQITSAEQAEAEEFFPGA